MVFIDLAIWVFPPEIQFFLAACCSIDVFTGSMSKGFA
jgi:hypothetical protein